MSSEFPILNRTDTLLRMATQKPTPFVIPPRAAARLIAVAKRYGPKAKVCRIGTWRSKSDRELWFCFLNQVMVAGGSRSVDRMRDSGDHALLAYRRLCGLSRSEQRRVIHRLFREHAVRWTERSSKECRKTRAVVHNLQVLRDSGGPTAYLERICAKGRPLPPVTQIATDFEYIGLKGSQDLAAELGLSRDAIAIDVRVLAVLKAAGVDVPRGVKTSPAKYAAVCEALRLQVCQPAGIEGYRLDRAMYQFKDDILLHLNNRS